MANSFFSDLLTSITESGRALLSRGEWRSDGRDPVGALLDLSGALLSGRGEASGTAMASEALARYGALSEADRLKFFSALVDRFGPDTVRLEAALEAFRITPSADSAQEIHYASEPRRQELFRRLNRAPGGTAALVALRADLLAVLGDRPALHGLDRDLAHLLGSWFNRGFLVLQRIDWSSPANVLEKIIRYEAVHEIRDWNDLRRRIDPPDRRCYAFFHPALVDEPLIFVEVALTTAMPSAIAPLLDEDRVVLPQSAARTAVFYSISNCQQGLAGISFGNFLIKQVVEELRRDLPKLDTFVTLSPVPGFARWLTREGALAEETAAMLDEPGWPRHHEQAERLRKVVEPLAAAYLLAAKTATGRPLDPVARFHLGNGARLERLNWLGDTSRKGLAEAAGMMVNYLYALESIERNHEAYAERGEVIAASSVRRLAASRPLPARIETQ
ncbi:MAG: malonyl-CoA decarboxylase [Aestuariivirgaceae bacterium]|jgi:malonyl-CoA decarboxylase